jgi:hypothetical protein
MQIRRDISLGTGLVATVCVGFSFVTIGLFARMAPAVEAILEDNVESQGAAFDILEALAIRRDGGLDLFEDGQLRAALARARGNITVPGEEAIVTALEEAAAAAFRGEEAGFRALSEGARQLWQLNMAAMREADDSASRLGSAGAWSAVFGGVAVILVALLSWRRLQSRVVMPVEELGRVLKGARADQPHLRCQTGGGTADVDTIRTHLNEILDRTSALQTDRQEGGKVLIRAALVTTLRKLPQPAVVVHADGRILAGNARGLRFFVHGPGLGVRDRLATEFDGFRRPFTVPLADGLGRVTVKPVAGTDKLALCIFVQAEPADQPAPVPAAPRTAAAAVEQGGEPTTTRPAAAGEG